MNYVSLTLERKSERDFRKKSVPGRAMDELLNYFQECRRLKPGIDVELLAFDEEALNALDNIAGYKGFMISAPSYLVLLSEDAEYSHENAGYIGEDMVLKATDLDLDTCWVTFGDSDEAKEALQIESDKTVMAIIALGYEKKELKPNRISIKSMSDVAVKELDEYRVARISIDEFVHVGEWDGSGVLDEEDVLLDAMEAARRAPTYLNKQPYRFLVHGNCVLLAVRNDSDTSEEIQKLGAGIVMLHVSGVLAQLVREIEWIMGAPEKDLQIPVDYKKIAYFNI